MAGLNFIKSDCLRRNVQCRRRTRIRARRTEALVANSDIARPEVAQVRLDSVNESGGKAVFWEPMFLHGGVWIAAGGRSKAKAVCARLPNLAVEHSACPSEVRVDCHGMFR